MFVVGDEDTAISVDLQPVRLAVVLSHDFERPERRNAEHPPVRNVDDVEVALAIEGWAFEKGRRRNAGSVRLGPRGRLRPVKRSGKLGENFSFDDLWRGKHP